MPLSSPDDIVRAYEKALDKDPEVKVAVIDHINAPTGLIFPVPELIALCRRRGVLSLIDGAHTPGHIPLSMEELEPDFYAGGFQKKKVQDSLMWYIIIDVAFYTRAS